MQASRELTGYRRAGLTCEQLPSFFSLYCIVMDERTSSLQYARPLMLLADCTHLCLLWALGDSATSSTLYAATAHPSSSGKMSPQASTRSLRQDHLQELWRVRR